MPAAFWSSLDRRRRIGFGIGLAAIAGATVLLAVWLLRPDYEVLFASLAPQDAAAMTSELDRMKSPYRLGPDGTSILVDRSTVHATRLKLMGKDLPLHGAVGFELFNDTDFGMTEFAQKINFQRAMQGEITRTILSLSEVESARVHLAFPEDGLFKRDQAKAKAAITLALRRGQALRPEQVSGIQRLVAAAVTGIAPGDVTIVDRKGIALTRSTDTDTPADASARLDMKADIERALTRKVASVLERSFGEGGALASVDVALDMDQVRVTTEDVRGQGDRTGATPTGVVVRERETLRDETAMLSVRDGTTAGLTSRETEYQVGRRVEQVVTPPGSIERIQVVAVIKEALDAAQREQVKAMIGAAVGASSARGDSVVVHSVGSFGTAQRSQPATDHAAGTLEGGAAGTPGGEAPGGGEGLGLRDQVASGQGPASTLHPTGSDAAPSPQDRVAQLSPLGWAALIGGLVVAMCVAGLAAARWRARRAGLSGDEREAALDKLRAWLSQDAAVAQGRSSETA